MTDHKDPTLGRELTALALDLPRPPEFSLERLLDRICAEKRP